MAKPLIPPIIPAQRRRTVWLMSFLFVQFNERSTNAMIQYDGIRNRLNTCVHSFLSLRAALDLDRGLAEAAELEKTAAPDFWDDPENSQRVLQRIKQLQGKAQRYDKLKSLFEDSNT